MGNTNQAIKRARWLTLDAIMQANNDQGFVLEIRKYIAGLTKDSDQDHL